MAESKPADGPVYHIATEGETLRDVALKYGVPDEDLVRLNGLNPNDELLPEEGVTVGFIPDPENPLSVSATEIDGLVKSKKTSFSKPLLAVQQELAVVGILLGEHVTGKPNRETAGAFRLWKQVLNYSAEEAGSGVDFDSLRELSLRRKRFAVVD